MIGEFALVMSVKEKKAVVLVQGGRFLQIKNRNFRVGQRILLEPSLLSFTDRVGIAMENTKEKIHRLGNKLRYKGLIILSSLAILIPTSGYAAAKFVPWTYVSMDTGSISIQYQVNALGEVLSTEILSEESQAVVDALPPVRYEKVEDAMDRAMNVIYADEFPLIKEPEPVLIGISTRFGTGEKTRDAIAEHIEPVVSAEISFEQLNWSKTGKAREEELSIGQYGRKMDPEARLEPEMSSEIPEKPVPEQGEGRDPIPEAPEGSKPEKTEPGDPAAEQSDMDMIESQLIHRPEENISGTADEQGESFADGEGGELPSGSRENEPSGNITPEGMLIAPEMESEPMAYKTAETTPNAVLSENSGRLTEHNTPQDLPSETLPSFASDPKGGEGLNTPPDHGEPQNGVGSGGPPERK